LPIRYCAREAGTGGGNPIYIRNQGQSVHPAPAWSGSRSPSPALLIPQDYHGELLRSPSAAGEPDPEPLPPPEPSCAGAAGASAETAAPPAQEECVHETASGLLGGLYDLIVGKNSSEEETVLLLGIIVLLLWGHLDRGSAFDIGTWGEEDLALFLIGYLLLS